MPECNGYITTVDETAQFAPGKRRSDPTFIITDVGIENGAMYAYIIGGWADGYPGWIKDRLLVGEPKHVPTIGTFTLLDITTAQAVYGHGSATELRNPDFVAMAESFGALGLRATTPDELRTALDEAVRAQRPTVIEVPMPRSLEQSPWKFIMPASRSRAAER